MKNLTQKKEMPQINKTGNGFFELTFKGKKMTGKEVTKQGFKTYEPIVFVNYTEFSEAQVHAFCWKFFQTRNVKIN